VPIDAIDDRFGLRRGIKAHLCLLLAPSASFENNSFGSTLSVPIQYIPSSSNEEPARLYPYSYH
jgi:hypothetical protein